MTKEQALKILQDFQLWRRGSDDIPQPEPKEIGIAIDVAIECLTNNIKQCKKR